MLTLRRGALAALLAASLLAACGDDDDDDDNNGGNGGGTELSAQEQQALITALGEAGFAGSEYSSFVFGGLARYGTFTVPDLGQFAGAGVQYLIDVTVNGEPVQGAAASVLAWQGLDAQAQTVDAIVEFGTFLEGATEFPDPTSGSIPGDVVATYWTAENDGTLFVGTTGTASLTGTDFGGSTVDCTTQVPDVGTLNCSYRYGRMSGSFAFDATASGGPTVVSFGETDFDLPAVRVTLTGDLTVPEQTAGEVRAALQRLAVRR